MNRARGDGGTPQRRFQRFPLEGSVRIYSSHAMWNAHLIDLSLRGVLVSEPDDWEGAILGSSYRVDLRIEGGVLIGMGVKLARIEPGQLGFACTKIDLDSFARLKRLVELNLGSVEMLGRELSGLG